MTPASTGTDHPNVIRLSALSHLFVASAIGLAACDTEPPTALGGSEGTEGDESALIDPANANALSAVIQIPGAVRQLGSPPQQTAGGPRINSAVNLRVDAGGQLRMVVNWESESGYEDCYVQVQGADDFLVISGVGSSMTSGSVEIPVTFPGNVGSGQTRFYTCISNPTAGVSNPLSIDIAIARPGEGGEGMGGTGGGETTGGEASGEAGGDVCLPGSANCVCRTTTPACNDGYICREGTCVLEVSSGSGAESTESTGGDDGWATGGVSTDSGTSTTTSG